MTKPTRTRPRLWSRRVAAAAAAFVAALATVDAAPALAVEPALDEPLGLDAAYPPAPALVAGRRTGPTAVPGLGHLLRLAALAPPPASPLRFPAAGMMPAARVAAAGPGPSGLPWRSGASCASAEFEAWRGRKLDSHVLFVWHDTWDQMVGRISSPYWQGAVKRSPQPVVSLAMMPRSEWGQHAKCAAGAFEPQHRRLGRLLRQVGAGNAIVRVGWEANVGSDSHPWGIDTKAQVPDYLACFRRAVTVLRKAAPGIKVEWTNAKASDLPFSVLDAYPGDSYVDVMGLHYYSIDDQFATQEAWNKFYDSTRFDGPQGIGRWVKTARDHGKKLGVPEWGVWQRFGTAAGADHPLYVENMYKTFRDNAADIAYDNWYNCPSVHQIGPKTNFPKASARYRQLWSAGK